MVMEWRFMIIGGSKFTPGTPLQHEMFLIICRQTDRHTDRQTDRQTDRETDRHNWKHYLLAYAGGNKQIMQFMQKFQKKIGKKPTAIFKPRGGNRSFWFPELILYEQRNITIEDPIFPEGGTSSPWGASNYDFAKFYEICMKSKEFDPEGIPSTPPLRSTNALTNLSWLPPSLGELAPFPGFAIEKRRAFSCSFQQIIRKLIGFWSWCLSLEKSWIHHCYKYIFYFILLLKANIFSKCIY